MPRLPTIRVIGSHVISTMLPFVLVVAIVRRLLSPRRPVPGRQFASLLPPLRLLVNCLARDLAQRPDDVAVQAAGGGRDLRTGRLVHEGHELVGEAGHGAPDADAPDVRAAADTVDPSPLRDVALHHRPPAAQL